MNSAKLFALSKYSVIECSVKMSVLFLLLIALSYSALPVWSRWLCIFLLVFYFLQDLILTERDETLSLLLDSKWYYQQRLWQLENYQIHWAGNLIIMVLREVSHRQKKILWLWPDMMTATGRSELVFTLKTLL
ncbi:MAG: hypothetical protein A3F17_02990 [Gammaproteobacteria bacterium RIFCSPHIGHO2_12_FULL_41_15]|nr:MAG: hypothetical protein A3F17_02990 [Gammaproteobacteria bacterium RIFCSPHIGHO2_12_FULL_41_15]